MDDHDAMEELRVEAAAAEDVEALFALRRSLEDWMVKRGLVQWPVGSLPRERVAEQVASGQVRVVRDDDGIVASLRLMWSDPDFWGDDATPAVYVHGLMVDRRATGSGLGRRLLDWAREQGKAAGVGLQRLDCRTTNPSLRAYYESLGFVAVGRQVFPTFEVTLLERPVTPPRRT
ncbi:N-acetyltransferase [Cellulomonas sp. JH27-2]|uniref:GNAT family N-acetyltransferase n=1 Tax=Cellulomonas sp. JH27-2 TaxID=2774139 RepID=UPI00271481AB|nr:GNAT family N-acetyltransferase [Cellulomonas sp. JH27-2]